MYQRRFRPPRHNNNVNNINLQLTRLPEVNEVGTLLVNGATSFARNHKFVTGWYLMGLLVLIFVSYVPGTPLTMQQQQQYQTIVNSIDLQAEYDATDHFHRHQQRYYATKGWFFSCDHVCQRNKRNMEEAQKALTAIRQEGNARMRDAKAVAGITSTMAVHEVQDSFWSYFESGKRFAKRQTGWDIFFMMLRSVGSRQRDESWAQYVVNILLQVVINFTMGLVTTLLFFILGLWNIVRSYQPNPMVAVLVFLAAASAGTAVVVTYLLALVGAAGGSVYGLAKFAETTARLQQAEQQRQQQRLHYD